MELKGVQKNRNLRELTKRCVGYQVTVTQAEEKTQKAKRLSRKLKLMGGEGGGVEEDRKEKKQQEYSTTREMGRFGVLGEKEPPGSG